MSMSYDTDEEEQVFQSVYLKYVKIHDYQLVLKCLSTHKGGLFEKPGIVCLVKFLYYYVHV